MVIMEVCVDSITSAINAEKGGANRLELCANLTEGGTTPSIGLIQQVKRKVAIPVFVMIRPRAGDFLYSAEEVDVMRADIIEAKRHNADGIVFGILTRDGNIDKDVTKELVEFSRPLPVTFHRAFDMTRDPISAMKTLMGLGCERILTSGQQSTALHGAALIAELMDMAKEKLIVMPGCGINAANVAEVIKLTGATELHCSARAAFQSTMTYRRGDVAMGHSQCEYEWLVCDSNVVQEIKAKASNCRL